MVTIIDLNRPDARDTGHQVTQAHFGAVMPSHHLNNDAGDLGAGATGLGRDLEEGGEFDVTLDAAGVRALRWPGGSFAEDEFDYRNPAMSSWGGNGQYNQVNLEAALTYCAANELAISFIMPMTPFKEGGPDEVERQKADVETYISTLLDSAARHGVTVRDIDLGNENLPVKEVAAGDMTARDYGEIAAPLAEIVSGVIDQSFGRSDPARPDLNIQPGIDATGDFDGNGTLDWVDVVEGFRDAGGDFQHITGLATHLLGLGWAASVNAGRIDQRFDLLDGFTGLVQRLPGQASFDPEINITAWNPPGADKYLSSLVTSFHQMVLRGADSMHVFTVEGDWANTQTFSTLGVNGSDALTGFGEAFVRLQDYATGKTAIALEGSGSWPIHNYNVQTSVFQDSPGQAGGSDQTVVWLSNTRDYAQTFEVQLDSLVGPFGHLFGTLISPTAPDAINSAHARVSLLTDEALQADGAGNVTVSLGAYEVLQLVYTAPDVGVRVLGDAQDDLLRGSDAGDTLIGALGDDTLQGGAGADLMRGGAGDDVLFYDGADVLWRDDSWIDLGGAGRDTLFVEAGARFTTNALGELGIEVVRGNAGNDFVRSAPTDAAFDLFGAGGEDTLIGSQGDDSLRGGDGRDMLRGGGGDDRIEGGTGADWIAGNLGQDVLAGGAGADVFVFARNGGVDTITDFEAGVDKIALRLGDAGFDDLAIEGTAGQARIGYGSDNAIIPVGLDAAQLSEADFVFL